MNSAAAPRELIAHLIAQPSAPALHALADALRAANALGSTQANQEVFELAEVALRALPEDDLLTQDRVICLLSVAIYYYNAAKPERALTPVEQAVAIAWRLDDPLWLVKALKLCGTIQADTGNVPRAVSAYAEALSIARDLGDPLQEGEVWNNLGVAYVYSSHYADAQGCFERAVALTEGKPGLRSVTELAYSNIALVSLHLRKIDVGLAAAEQALAGPEPTNAQERLRRVYTENFHARLLIEDKRLDEARDRARRAKEMAAASGVERAMLMAAVAEGLAEVHGGQTDIGLSRLKVTVERARSGVPGMLHEALAALMQGYAKAGQKDVALLCLRELQRMHEDGRGAQLLMHHRQHLTRLDDSLDSVARSLLQQTQTDLRGLLVERELIKSRMALLEQQSVAAELHDDTTGEHCYRVGRLASLLAADYGVDEETCFMINLAARLHDIGKLAVPDSILLKPARLTPEERTIMERHTTAGAALLAKSNVPQLHVAEEIAIAHHERWDGRGYPHRLKGAQIPLAARITALADVFDALTHVRPYKQAWPVEAALQEIWSLRGLQFDPELTDRFIDLVIGLQKRHASLDAFLAADAKSSPFIAARAKIAAALKAEVNKQGLAVVSGKPATINRLLGQPAQSPSTPTP